MKFSDKLKGLRLSRQMSLTELAKRAGINKGYLSSLETGRQDNPGIHHLEKLARELSVELNYFSDDFNPKFLPGKKPIPKGLQDFIKERKREKHPLTAEDIGDLKKIEFRGVKSFSARDYELLHSNLELLWKNKKRK